LFFDHYWIREVTIPEDVRVVEFGDKVRADKVILGSRMALSDASTWRYLVQQGVDIHVKNDYVLCWAADNGYLEIVDYLLKHGADIYADRDHAIYDVVNYLKSE